MKKESKDLVRCYVCGAIHKREAMAETMKYSNGVGVVQHACKSHPGVQHERYLVSK